MLFLLAFLIGVVAGSRTMTAPTAIAWAAHLGWLDLGDSVLSFFGWPWTAWIFTGLALVELVVDQLPSTQSRTVPMQFGARLISGALCGAAIGVAAGSLPLGAALGVAGAIVGTLGGARARGAMARAFGRDTPAALIEDAVAIGLAALIAVGLR